MVKEKLLLLLSYLLLICNSNIYAAVGDTWDLSADWSDAVNPFGAWSVTDPAGTAMNQNVAYADAALYAAGETIWSMNPGNSWMGAMKMDADAGYAYNTATNAYLAGDIVGHAEHQIRWTAPEAGQFRFTGDVFRIRNNDSVNALVWENSTGAWLSVWGSGDLAADNDRNNSIVYDITLDMDAGEQFVLAVGGNDYLGRNMTVEHITNGECDNRSIADLDGNCIVDLADLAVFVCEWLDCGLSIQSDCFME